MRTKEKSKKRAKITIKNVLVFLAFIISLFYCTIFYNYYFVRNRAYAKETDVKAVDDIVISNAKKIDIDEILANNANENKKEEYVVEEAVLEYITKYQSNESLPKGVIQVVQEGQEGKQQVTIKKTYINGELTSEEQVNSKIVKASINKIVEVGAGKYTSSHKIKVGDTLYITSDRLAVMIEPNEQAEKMTTLSKGNEIKLLEQGDFWYKIAFGNTIGYVKSENTTYIDPNSEYTEEKYASEKSKAELMNTLSFNMALNKPSGLSLKQFKKILSDSKDTNKIFENNAEYFYYIEKQYKINGVFVAAIGIHESSWGTSKIAKEKNNLFGYGANDSNPYNGAYTFSNYSESIDLLSRVLVKYYLNPKGTNIYGGEKAEGTYYNKPNLSGVNLRYASDKNWANGVYSHMKYLYNKL